MIFQRLTYKRTFMYDLVTVSTFMNNVFTVIHTERDDAAPAPASKATKTPKNEPRSQTVFVFSMCQCLKAHDNHIIMIIIFNLSKCVFFLVVLKRTISLQNWH